ncbi:SDR family NAD(P)-dependent oxidoreductase [Aeromonas salmonicida]|uniref:SDR family NAD(P)-dependent oxidoreductase n=1 Tax=Aeromonas salmonicida TaxID=645 RepID=UPI00073CD0DA|nr:SDR family oxidoreductase [Aeromonas salmonicida]KTA77284.1 short-chain dehydrogenase [Aeromonas salmonicida]MDE7529653.1 SDR family oxidoreductase [Aeromonas salmonicida]MDE7533932.1 SDR family oxidoreductase [Aeromonas salmonicida]
MTRSIALITGASRGLGKHSAMALAAKGVDLIITYRSQAEEAATVVALANALGVKAHALPLDVADSASFAAFAAEVRQLLQREWQRERFDFLVNNAGIGIHTSFEQTTEQQFDTLMNIHLKGTFFLTQQLLPLIRDGGRIINLSTGLTRFALPGYAAYAAMKGGIEVLTRYLAKELGPRGIAVNVVAPGAIETDFGGGVVRDNQAVNDVIASQTALGRVGQPDDIGGVIAALLSDDNRWVNAQRIEASGGMFI